MKYGVGYRSTDAISGTLWPGNMILAIVNSPTDLQAQVFRQGNGGNRANYLDFYVGDTISHDRITVDLGIRYDRQWGKALPSTTLPNAAFPTVVPGLQLHRLRYAVHLEQHLAARRAHVRARRGEEDDRAGELQPLLPVS